MPQLLIKSIDCFSSQDPAFPASNLLTLGKKWICEKPGESSAFVVLRLEKAAVLTGIDIGNEHSMFVTISVGNYGSNKEFQEILLTSSFMTGVESRNSEKKNRVRCFDHNALIDPVASEKWDLIKVLCTQTVNRHVQYGLSFIKIRGIIDKKEEPNMNFRKLGNFKIREDSPDSENDVSSSSLFSRWKQNNQNLTPARTAAAAIREASNPSSLKNYKNLINKQKVTKPNESPHPFLVVHDSEEDDDVGRNRDKLFYDKEDDKPNEKFEKKLAEDNAKKERNYDELIKNKTTKTETSKTNVDSAKKIEDKSKRDSSKTKTSNIDVSEKLKLSSLKYKSLIDIKEEKVPSTPTSNIYSKTPAVTKKRPLSPLELQEPKRVKSKAEPVYRKFNKLLEGIVIVISGIQNPERSELRSKALELGADYRQDWEEGCTHLICAFANTPKFRQVKGQGKIVKKDWIHKCHELKKQIPWRRYALDSQDGDKSDSENEILELHEKPETSGLSSLSVNEANNKTTNSFANYDNTDDDEATGGLIIDSGSEDTEEEIERVLGDNKKGTQEIDLFDKSTDEDNDEQSRVQMSQSQSSDGFFKNKYFILNEDLGAVDVVKIKSIIEQQKGKITSNVNKGNYLISNVEVALPSTFNGEMLKPRWIFECADMDCLLPTKRYKL